MADGTKIEWATSTLNPIRARYFEIQSDGSGKERIGWHCEHITGGCKFCYAEVLNKRLGTGRDFAPDELFRQEKVGYRNGEVKLFFDEKMLAQPLHWRRPRRIFWNSMTDTFADFVPDEWIDRQFAVCALTPHHTHLFLTKRAKRMREYCSDSGTPWRVGRQIDCIEVQREIATMGPEEIRQISGYPGYYVSDRGRILSTNGSRTCLFCGNPVTGLASKSYCSKKCKQNACYYRRTGRPQEGDGTPTYLKPDAGEQGHLRVTLYRDGKSERLLVHRLVLEAFVGPPPDDRAQACHRNGDPSVNSLPNLRWGTQSNNWDDSKHHGSHRRYSKLTPEQAVDIRQRYETGESAAAIGREFDISATQARNIGTGKQWAIAAPIEWPLPGCWLGVSVEDQARADERIPELLATPAAVRFISAEPLLSDLDIAWALSVQRLDIAAGFLQRGHFAPGLESLRHLDWVIAGSESGPNARPCDLDWVRSLRDQCTAAGVSFFWKQYVINGKKIGLPELDGRTWDEMPGDPS